MRCICGEANLLIVCGVQAIEGIIQDFRKPLKFKTGGLHRNSLRIIAGSDAAGGAYNLIDRSNCPACHLPSTCKAKRHHDESQ